jgi:hypothetical protein
MSPGSPSRWKSFPVGQTLMCLADFALSCIFFFA